MRFILILMLLVYPSFAGESGGNDPKLPPDVQKVVDAHDAEVAKAKAAYDAAVAKANETGAKAMDAVVKARMAKQDLAGAVAAKAVVEKWRAEQPDPLGDKPAVAKKPDQSTVVGTWMVANLAWKFNKDGTWYEDPENGGTWRYQGKQVIMTATKGNNGTYMINPKDGEFWSMAGSKGKNAGIATKVSDEP